MKYFCIELMLILVFVTIGCRDRGLQGANKGVREVSIVLVHKIGLTRKVSASAKRAKWPTRTARLTSVSSEFDEQPVTPRMIEPDLSIIPEVKAR